MQLYPPTGTFSSLETSTFRNSPIIFPPLTIGFDLTDGLMAADLSQADETVAPVHATNIGQLSTRLKNGGKIAYLSLAPDHKTSLSQAEQNVNEYLKLKAADFVHDELAEKLRSSRIIAFPEIKPLFELLGRPLPPKVGTIADFDVVNITALEAWYEDWRSKLGVGLSFALEDISLGIPENYKVFPVRNETSHNSASEKILEVHHQKIIDRKFLFTLFEEELSRWNSEYRDSLLKIVQQNKDRYEKLLNEIEEKNKTIEDLEQRVLNLEIQLKSDIRIFVKGVLRGAGQEFGSKAVELLDDLDVVPFIQWAREMFPEVFLAFPL